MKINLPINTTAKQAETAMKKVGFNGEYSRQTPEGFVCSTKGLMFKTVNGKLYSYQTDKQMWVEIW